jgi:hypothetical protein
MKSFTMLRNEADGSGDGGGGAAVVAGESGGSLLGTGAAVETLAQAGQAQGSQAQTNAGTGAFDFRSLVGDDGRFSADWADRLPPELAEHKAHFSKYATPVQALQHTLSLSQLLGKKSDAVVIPAADAPKEEWAPVLKRLGVPDSPEGYGLKVPDTLPDGVTVNPEELKEFATFAHNLGLTPQQVAKLQEYDIGRAGKSVEGSAAAAAAQEASVFKAQAEMLTKEWGNGNEAIQKKALAERAALTFGFTPEDIKSDPLFRNARFVMTLARAGAAMSEDTLVKGADVTSSGGMKAKAFDVINNPQNPMYKRYWDGDPDANAQVRNWMTAG